MTGRERLRRALAILRREWSIAVRGATVAFTGVPPR